MDILKINGHEKQFPDGVPGTLRELVEQMHINESTIVAEVEGEIVAGADFATTRLSGGQCIELIRFVGGG